MWTSHLSALDLVVSISLKLIRMKKNEDIEEKWKIINGNEWKLLEIVVNDGKRKKNSKLKEKIVNYCKLMKMVTDLYRKSDELVIIE